MSGAVARELKQTARFASVEQEVLLGLRVAASRALDPWARFLKTSAELTVPQYNVLRILRGAGTDGLPTLTIRDRMVHEAPGITRLIDKLEEAGLARRERAVPDRRQVFCFITQAGLDLLASLDGPVNAADDAAVEMLSKEDQQLLISLLDAVRAGHRKHSRDNETRRPA